MQPPNPDYMRLALKAARRGMRAGRGGPFGACIVRSGTVIAMDANAVLGRQDPTAHAEISAIRGACAKARTHLLDGAEIYSTTEPCPMCFAAIHWARIGRIVYGTQIADVQRLGFNEMPISNEQMRDLGHSPVEVVGGFLVEECEALLAEWQRLPNRSTY